MCVCIVAVHLCIYALTSRIPGAKGGWGVHSQNDDEPNEEADTCDGLGNVCDKGGTHAAGEGVDDWDEGGQACAQPPFLAVLHSQAEGQMQLQHSQ